MTWKSKYFTLNEMTASHVAKRKGISNKPTEAVKANLQALVTNVLDPLREEWGAPIIVTSGYRSPRLNAAVGGAVRSQHTLGQAADIRTVSDRPEENKKLRDLLIKLNLPYDQVIDEFGCDWIHVSHRENNRGQLLSARRVKGRTIYTAGIK